MKKVFLIISLLLLSVMGQSQFVIKGEIENYNNKPVILRIYKNGLDKFLTKVETDKKGEFLYKVPFAYTGLIQLELAGGRFQLISDNTDIDFKIDINSPIKRINAASGVNKVFADYNDYQTYLSIKDKSILPLQAFYTPNQPFYKALEQEKNRINNMKPAAINNSGLAYYIETQKILDSYSNKQKTPIEIKEDAKSHLMKDDLNLENFGFLPGFVMQYLSYSIQGAKSRDEAKQKLKESIDSLLNSVDEETPRGQSVLLTVINLLKSTDFKELAKDYTNRAATLTCEVNPELKSLLHNRNNVVVGKKVPNIIFDKEVKGKKSLYDIKADKKLLIFWGSWCGYCKHEWPFIKAFYPEFKKEGGEILAFAVDLQKEDYEDFTKDTDWYNYSDLLKWDSPVIKEFEITGTPTFILLDKDNKVLKIGSRVADFSNFNN